MTSSSMTSPMPAAPAAASPVAAPASLMRSRRFAPLFWCQFFSAFSDNFLKNALVFLILFQLGGPGANALITLAAAVFILPYFFLSGLGGEFADRHDKAWVAQRLKLAEIGISVIAVIGFAMHSVIVLFVALFLFGVIGSLFGPIKYGILPDHLARSELPAGNALVEGATFIAILLGTIVGGLAAKDGGDPTKFALLMIVFSLLCWGSSLLIPPTGEAAPDLTVRRNILASTWDLIRHLQDDRRVWWGALVTSWFWLVGAVALSLLPPLVKNALGGTEEVVTAFLAVFSVAIAVGSASRLGSRLGASSCCRR
jgi:acyl-[acyl-carrier-protein]-phospholipid O-acyltransferase/long-chain-fatty-acid--[acyl-carrier-protein] ligase